MKLSLGMSSSREVSQFPLVVSETRSTVMGSVSDSERRWLSFVMFLERGRFLKVNFGVEVVVVRPVLNDDD